MWLLSIEEQIEVCEHLLPLPADDPIVEVLLDHVAVIELKILDWKDKDFCICSFFEPGSPHSIPVAHFRSFTAMDGQWACACLHFDALCFWLM